MAASPPSRPPPAPYIVTAELPPQIFRWADALRQAHYPAERNVLAAHVTLFHGFAPSLRGELGRVLARHVAEFAAPDALVGGLMDLGTGTAVAVRSADMLAIRAMIAAHFHGALTAQDRHSPRLHITIQNKVDTATAKALQQELKAGMIAHRFRFAGLGLYCYHPGRWDRAGVWPFRGKQRP
ncbi:MAG: 2'-5' RNA ligase family protein [Proteobacteria bacterium]|nr:2'-5' RNA ligase family protein [Pseudomonadota bacterium]